MLYNTLYYINPVHPEMIHRNNPKHEIFRFDIQSEMATETEFKTLLSRVTGLGRSMEHLHSSIIRFFFLQVLFFVFKTYAC